MTTIPDRPTLDWHGFRPSQRVWCPATTRAGTVPTEREARGLFLHLKATGVPVRFDDSDTISDVPPEHLTTSAPVTAALRFTDPLGMDVTVDLCQLIQPGAAAFDLNWGVRVIVGEAVQEWVGEDGDDSPEGIEWQDAYAMGDDR